MPPAHRIKVTLESRYDAKDLSMKGIDLKKGQEVTTDLHLSAREITSLRDGKNPVDQITRIICRRLFGSLDDCPKDGMSIICDIEEEKLLLPGRAVRVTGKWEEEKKDRDKR